MSTEIISGLSNEILYWIGIEIIVFVIPSLWFVYKYYKNRNSPAIQVRRWRLATVSIIISILYMLIHHPIYLLLFYFWRIEYEWAILFDDAGFSFVFIFYIIRIWHVYFDRKLGRTEFNKLWKDILNPDATHKGEFFIKNQQCLGRPQRTIPLFVICWMIYNIVYLVICYKLTQRTLFIDIYEFVEIVLLCTSWPIFLKFICKINPSIDAIHIRTEILTQCSILTLCIIIQKMEYIVIRYLIYTENAIVDDGIIIIFNVIIIGLLFILISYTTWYIQYKIDKDIEKGYDVSNTTRLQEYRRKVKRNRDKKEEENKTTDSDDMDDEPQKLEIITGSPSKSDHGLLTERRLNGHNSLNESVETERATITSQESGWSSFGLLSSRRSGSKRKTKTFKKINESDCDMWSLINDKTGLVIFLTYLKKEKDMDRLVFVIELTKFKEWALKQIPKLSNPSLERKRRLIEDGLKLNKFPDNVPKSAIIEDSNLHLHDKYLKIFEKYILEDEKTPYPIKELSDSTRHALYDKYRRVKNHRYENQAQYLDTNQTNLKKKGFRITMVDKDVDHTQIFDIIDRIDKAIQEMFQYLHAVFKQCTHTKEFVQWYHRLSDNSRSVLRRDIKRRRNRVIRNKIHLEALRVVSWTCCKCTNINRQHMEGNIMGVAPPFCRLCGEPQIVLSKRHSPKQEALYTFISDDEDALDAIERKQTEPERQQTNKEDVELAIEMGSIHQHLKDIPFTNDESLQQMIEAGWDTIQSTYTECNSLETAKCAMVQRMLFIIKYYQHYKLSEDDDENPLGQIYSMNGVIESLNDYSTAKLLDDFYHIHSEHMDLGELFKLIKVKFGDCNAKECLSVHRNNRDRSNCDVDELYPVQKIKLLRNGGDKEESNMDLAKKANIKMRNGKRRSNKLKLNDLTKRMSLKLTRNEIGMDDDNKSEYKDDTEIEDDGLDKEMMEEVVALQILDMIHCFLFHKSIDDKKLKKYSVGNQSVSMSGLAELSVTGTWNEQSLTFERSDDKILESEEEDEFNEYHHHKVLTGKGINGIGSLQLPKWGNIDPRSYAPSVTSPISVNHGNHGSGGKGPSNSGGGKSVNKYITDSTFFKKEKTKKYLFETENHAKEYSKSGGHSSIHIKEAKEFKKEQIEKPKKWQYKDNKKDDDDEEIYEYGFGFKFYYHEYMPFYKSMKCELLKNKVHPIMISSWNENLVKAKKYAEMERITNLTQNGRGANGEKYGIVEPNQIIGINNIVAVLLYCNFDNLQNDFSKSFRLPPDGSKTKKQTIDGHCKNFYHWGRSLYVAIQFFGQPMEPRTIVYHGLSHKMLFSDFSTFFDIPTSTTASKSVAHTFSGSSGIILALKSKYKNDCSVMLNVSLFSDYIDEQERLFLHETLIIHDIIAMKEWKKYPKQMKALNWFNKITTGNALDQEWNVKDFKDKTQSLLQDLICDYMQHKHLKKGSIKRYNEKIPRYVRMLFAYYCDKEVYPQFTNIDKIKIKHELAMYFFDRVDYNKYDDDNNNNDEIMDDKEYQNKINHLSLNKPESRTSNKKKLINNDEERNKQKISELKILHLFPNAQSYRNERGIEIVVHKENRRLSQLPIDHDDDNIAPDI